MNSNLLRSATDHFSPLKWWGLLRLNPEQASTLTGVGAVIPCDEGADLYRVFLPQNPTQGPYQLVSMRAERHEAPPLVDLTND